jgi:hypothetical protein
LRHLHRTSTERPLRRQDKTLRSLRPCPGKLIVNLVIEAEILPGLIKLYDTITDPEPRGIVHHAIKTVQDFATVDSGGCMLDAKLTAANLIAAIKKYIPSTNLAVDLASRSLPRTRGRPRQLALRSKSSRARRKERPAALLRTIAWTDAACLRCLLQQLGQSADRGVRQGSLRVVADCMHGRDTRI